MAPTYNFVLPSTFGLTVLLSIGLGFFIRASAKDRTETALYVSSLDDVALLETVCQHFEARAYQAVQVNPEESRIQFQGKVGASPFLAVFLGGLAGIGLVSIILVLRIAFPRLESSAYWLLIVTPIAPIFYWRGANRVESVEFQLEALENQDLGGIQATTGLKISAHRDELIALEANVPVKRVAAEH